MEITFLQDMIKRGRSLTVPKDADVRSKLGSPFGVFLLKSGWVSASTLLCNGGVQIFKIHLPGDILGAPSLAFDEPVEDLTALTSAEVVSIPTLEMERMFLECPSLAYRCFLSAQQERVFLMDRLAIGGQLGAKRAVAAFLIDLHDRIIKAQLMEGARMSTPLTQDQTGQIFGMLTVHVNRVLRSLERAGLIVKARREYNLLNTEALRELAGNTQAHFIAL